MNCIVMCSGKGGTGKSCVAAYTGAALAGQGRKTLLMELGGDVRSLDLILGTQAAPFGIRDVLAGRCDADEATLSVDGVEGLFLMPAGSGEFPEPKALESLIKALRLEYDYLLIDGIDPDRFPLEAATVCLLTVTPDTLAVRSAADLCRTLYARGAPQVRLVINSVPAQIVPIEGVEDFDALIDAVGAQLIGVIPQSPRLHFCANNGTALDRDSITVKVFENIAARLAGGRRPLLIR